MLGQMPADQIAVLYPQIMEQKLCRAGYNPMTSRKWLDIVGWLNLPAARHYCVDWGLEQMAKSLDRLIWVDDVVLAHRHWKRSPDGIPQDDLYRRNEGYAKEDTRIVHASNAIYAEKVELLREAMQ